MHTINMNKTLDIIIQQLNLQSDIWTADHKINMVIAEYIRNIINYLCLCDDGTIKPVYKTKLFNVVNNHLRPILQGRDENINHIIKVIFHRLIMIRDLSVLSGGYILPAPVRVIKVPFSDIAILVGGADTNSLSDHFGATIKYAGFARYIDNKAIYDDKIKKEIGILWQDIDSWLGWDYIYNIKDWIKKRIKNAKNQFKNVSVEQQLNIEVYYPIEKKNDIQNQRWISIKDLKKYNNDIIMCKIKEGKRYYYFWGALSKQSPYSVIYEAPINRQDILKVKYGLDAYYDCPTEISLKINQYCQINLKNKLIKSHQRLLYAFAQKYSQNNSVYNFSLQFKKIIIHEFKRIGIIIKK